MKATILDINGKKTKEISLPSFFSSKIRQDIILKILEAKKNRQPYAPSPVAGKQYSARGKIRHLRHVWKSGYGRGESRVPKKIFSRRGSQFIWEAAAVPSARGGLRAHPPKILSMINTKKINKKEMQIAMKSALSATANQKEVAKKYSTIDQKEISNIPFVVETKITNLKTKQLVSSLKKIVGADLFEIALRKKKVRPGKGKLRGRKYKTKAGLLLVLGKDEKLKTNAIDTITANKLGVTDLAKGGTGRLTIYTEQAIKDLEERLK